LSNLLSMPCGFLGHAPRLLQAGVFALASFSLMGVGARAARAAGTVSCRAERLGGRALAHSLAVDLFDRELQRLVELGLVGRLNLEVVLFQRRPLWFDRRAAEATRTFTVVWSKAEAHFTLDGQRLTTPREVRFPDLVLRPEDDGLSEGDFYFQLTVRLEVITAQSLGEVARWLVSRPAAQPEPAAQPRAAVLPRALVDYLASDLARTATGRCPVPR
jgi:hypothetical protein